MASIAPILVVALSVLRSIPVSGGCTAGRYNAGFEAVKPHRRCHPYANIAGGLAGASTWGNLTTCKKLCNEMADCGAAGNVDMPN